MTRAELAQIATEAYDRLGFVVDEDDPILWSLMRHTTRRRAEQAIATAADDTGCTTTLKRYHRLLDLLQKPVALVHQ